MRYSYIIVFCAMVLTTITGCTHVPLAPTANEQPVISIEQRSTMFRMISQRSGRAITPGIDIFADGRCSVRTFGGEELERSLPPSEVRKLLEFFERQGLFTISDASIARAIHRELEPVVTELPDGSVLDSTRAPLIIADGTHTRLAVRTATQKFEISRYQLQSELDYYPTVIELRTIQRCVEKVYEVAGKIN